MVKVYTGLAGSRRGEAKPRVGEEKFRSRGNSPLLRFIARRDVIEKVADNGAICIRFE